MGFGFYRIIDLTFNIVSFESFLDARSGSPVWHDKQLA